MGEPKKAKKPFGKYLSLSLKLQWTLTGWLTVAMPIFDAVLTVSSIGRSYLYALIINLITSYLSGNISTVFPKFWYLVAITGLFGILELAGRNFQDYLMTKTEVASRYKLDRLIAERCAELDAAYFEDPKFQDTLSRVDKLDINWVMRLLSRMLSDVVSIVIAAVAVLSLSPVLFVLAAVSSVPRLASSLINADRFRELNVILSEKRRLNWSLRSNLSEWQFIRELRPAGAIGAFLKRFRANHDDLSRQEVDQQKQASVVEGTAEGIGVVTSIITRVWLFLRVINTNGAFGIGDYTFYDNLVSRLENSSSNLVRNFRTVYEQLANVEDFFVLMNATPKIVQPEHAIVLPHGGKIPVVEFYGVSFTYPGTSKKVLKDVSFRLESGQKMALIGVNGAGKTTLTKLLLRFYDPDEGQILVDGVDLREINLDSWYRKLAVIQQDFNRYPLTAAQNIAFDPTTKADPKRLKKAISDAQADFVYQLPKKEDTLLTRFYDSSVELSGGQWQKIALARAFYRQADVLVLDEPTSAIDARAEAAIFNSLWKMQAGKGAIVISHRFSTVRDADLIVVMDNGKIIEQGKHEELMKQTGVYHELFCKQAKSYQ